MRNLCINCAIRWFSGLFFLSLFSTIQAASRAERLKIAEAWAPVIYQELSLEYMHPLTGFNPVDHIVGLNFDGNFDLRDNGDTVFSLAPSREVEALNHIPIYFSLIETDTHYYLNYIVYHAVDMGASPHSHDTENLWVIVEKKGGPYGTLVGNIANAHGLAMIYLADENEELRWRAKLPDDMRRKLAPLVDKFSTEHHSIGRPEYIIRQDSKSLKIFVAARTHALYKLNEDIWKSSGAAGSIYYPRSCGECPAQIFGEGRPYVLVDWDHWMDGLLTDFEEKNLDFKDLVKYFSSIDVAVPIGRSKYIERALPSFLAASFKDEKPAGLIFYRSSMGTKNQLIDPAAKHIQFVNKKVNVSQNYIQNTYLRVRSSPDFKKSEYIFKEANMMRLLKNLFGLTRE